jgi:hypothetical protein
MSCILVTLRERVHVDVTYASTSTLTFTVPSHISNVFLRMASAVLYSKGNRRVGLLKTM